MTSDGYEEEEWKDEDFLSFERDEEEEQQDDDGQYLDAEEPDRTSVTGFPPWMDKVHGRNVPPLIALHNEIVGFYRLMEPLEEEIKQRNQLVERFESLIKKAFEGATIKVFGSQATGLSLPSSDIDVVICMPEKNETKEGEEEGGEHTAAKPSPLQHLAAKLREEWRGELSYLEVVENTKVPLVKFTHRPSNVSLDASFLHPGQANPPNGPQAATLMKTYLEALPPLRPLTFLLKYFLAARGLNEPYSGGVGSYMLQLLIVAFLQHRARHAFNYKRPSASNLGAMLLEFLDLFGNSFNFFTTGVSVRNDGFFFPKGVNSRIECFWNQQRPYLCALENPLEPTMNVSTSSFRIQTVQRAFAVAHRQLAAHVTSASMPKSLLATILEPTTEMTERRWYVRRHRPLAARRLDQPLTAGRKEQQQQSQSPAPKRRRFR
jgi:non-canonical poly(A) RNA polymerase PAPD5/7